MGQELNEYRPLMLEDTDSSPPRKVSNPWRLTAVVVILVFQAALNITLIAVGWHFYHRRGPDNPIFPQALYSPVGHLLKYEVRTFQNGFGSDKSIYQGPPSKELDDAWEGLYNSAISKIPKSQAAQLANKTYPLLGDEDNYVVGLDVFHQNMIRQALYPDHYRPMYATNSSEFLGFSHIDHCIDSIRQSLMCASDVSAIVWQWNEKKQMVKIHADIAHTCRRFDLILDWARVHHLKEEVNMAVKLEDDIVIPIIH